MEKPFILITGASGFIGRHLINALISKFGKENILAITSSPLENVAFFLHHDFNIDQVEFIKRGLNKKVTHIIHAASFIPKKMEEINQIKPSIKSITFFESILSIHFPNIRKCTLLSTIDVYGPVDLISEDSPLIPSTLYGLSKLYLERILNLWSIENNITAQILRLGHIYGPGEEKFQKIIPLTIQKIIKNQPIEIYGDGKDIRTFIFIDDLISAIIKSLDLSKDIGPVNIVGNQTISMNELVKKLIKISNRQIEIIYKPGNYIPRKLQFNNLKYNQYLKVSETDLEIGLQKEFNYFHSLYPN